MLKLTDSLSLSGYWDSPKYQFLLRYVPLYVNMLHCWPSIGLWAIETAIFCYTMVPINVTIFHKARTRSMRVLAYFLSQRKQYQNVARNFISLPSCDYNFPLSYGSGRSPYYQMGLLNRLQTSYICLYYIIEKSFLNKIVINFHVFCILIGSDT